MAEYGMYHDDEYIRDLGLSNHPCFGEYDDQDTVCATCPAKTVCDQRRVVVVASTLVDVNELPLPVVVIAKEKRAVVDKKLYKVMNQVTQKETDCSHCGSKIWAGDESTWVRSKTQPVVSRTFHKECCEVL